MHHSPLCLACFLLLHFRSGFFLQNSLLLPNVLYFSFFSIEFRKPNGNLSKILFSHFFEMCHWTNSLRPADVIYEWTISITWNTRRRGRMRKTVIFCKSFGISMTPPNECAPQRSVQSSFLFCHHRACACNGPKQWKRMCQHHGYCAHSRQVTRMIAKNSIEKWFNLRLNVITSMRLACVVIIDRRWMEIFRWMNCTSSCHCFCAVRPRGIA